MNRVDNQCSLSDYPVFPLPMDRVFGYLTSPLKSVAQTFAQIEDDLQDQESTEERNVTINTTKVFALVDVWNVGFAWEVSKEGKIPDDVQEDARHGIEKIKENFQTDGKVRNNNEAIEKAWGIAKAFEDLAERLDQPPDRTRPEVTTTVDPSESKFDARELLHDDIRKYLRILFIALVRQLDCCDENHFARLKLTGFFDAQSRSFFDLYLSSRHDWPPCRWQETRCTITGTLSKREEPGCHVIQSSELKRKNLKLLLEEALQLEAQEIPESTGAQESRMGTVQLDRCDVLESSASPTISLWEILKQGGREAQSVRNSDTFLPRVRDTLCLNLALSLLQLSNDEWRRVRWCSDENTSIFFLKDPGTQEIRDKTRPYLSWRLQKDPKTEDSDGDLLYDPQLLDFAQLLVEIHRWERLPPDIESRRAESKQDFRLALSKFANDHFRPSDKHFRMAFKACLDIAGTKSRDQSSPGKIREYIFQKIVLPLEAYIGDPEPPESTSATLPSSDATSSSNTENKSKSMSMYDQSIHDNEPEDKSSQAHNFFNEIAKFNENNISCLKCSKYASRIKLVDRKIRIAVIDSGVRMDDPIIAGARSGKTIQDCRNFSSSDPKYWNDEVGHGTMVTRLLMIVSPEAELYIAKVSNEKTIPSNKLYHIGEAINWAVQHWEVDIITISIALSEENHDIDKELEQALDPKYNNATGKIVFAAAGNKGGNEQLAWPARKNGVIAIHATDWQGTAANLNPSGDEGKANFATLGRDIKMRWFFDTGEVKDCYISGTSFATPIAAGIAANILEFARYRLDLNTRRKDRLFSHDGMRKIFREMSTRRGDYHYVQPWTLWEEAYKGDWGNPKDMELTPHDPENIRKVLEFIIGKI